MKPFPPAWIFAGGVLFLIGGAILLSQKTPDPLHENPAQASSTEKISRAKYSSGEASGVRKQTLSEVSIHWLEANSKKELGAFQHWTQKYLAAAEDEKVALRPEGVALAGERRKAIKDLIRTDPEAALAATVPIGIRRELPREIENLLEERVSGRGQLALLGALAEPGKEKQTPQNFRTATIGEKTFEAFVYGWREGEPTRNKIPLHGIAIDGKMAVSANSVRLLEPEEIAAIRERAREAICGVSKLPVNTINQETAAEVGGEIIFFCRGDHAKIFNEQQVAAEDGPPSPDSPSGPEASSYTEGQKGILLIRLDFPDLPGAPITDTAGTNLISNLNNFYTEMSYGRTSFKLAGQGSEVTPTLRMPNNASYYGTNNYYDALRADAKAAAATNGYVVADYNFDVMVFGTVPGWTWSGLGYVGAPGAWLRNAATTGVAGHEIGHNYGLNHANFWDTGGATIIGAGSSIEYGDGFDTMGAASAGNNHFNARYKSYLNWLQTGETQTITSNGTYRIYAHDNAASTGLRGLKIVKNVSTNYWIEFRQKFSSNPWLMNGAGLRWAFSGNQKSLLLDTTPGSPDGKTDSAIVIGRTFSDQQSNIHITPIGKGGTVPESLDVVVNFGNVATNLAPTLQINAATTNAATGATLTFTATASDPNGDSLAYYWDFGDSTFGTNGASASKSWSSANEYVVRCVVTDMKGGVASDSVIVRIGSPSTFRISGKITSLGAPMEGVRVTAASSSLTRVTYTDSDGTYNLVGLTAATYTVTPVLDNAIFAATNFVNPVVVGPNKATADFFDTQGLPAIMTQPANQVSYINSSAGFTVNAVGAAPLSFQWRFNNGAISGATNSNYTLPNVQSNNVGSYTVLVTNGGGAITSQVATLTLTNAIVQILFSDNFDSDTSGSWTLNRSSTDTRVTFNCNYATNGIPSAPNSIGGTTRGVKFEANIANSLAAALNISPTGKNFSGDYRLRFDMWINANGPFPGGGTGSSEHLTAGVATTGNRVQWTGSGTTADGFWFGVDGEGGATTNSSTPDFSAFNATALQTAASGIYAAGTVGYTRDNSHSYYATTFPAGKTAPALQQSNFAQQTGALDVGCVGFAWHDVLITKQSNSVTWSIDGLRIASFSNVSFSATGTNIFIGYWDAFNSLSDNAALSFGIVDNVRVERTVIPAVIAARPQDRNVILSSNTTFTVSATGTLLTYQWKFNGSNIPNATASSYTRTNAQLADAGSYSVLVTNFAASVLSGDAVLTVLEPPDIVAQPPDQFVAVGGSALFNIDVIGTDPLQFQWKKNGTNIANATFANLSIDGVQKADAGTYRVQISNNAGSIESAPALLIVNSPPALNSITDQIANVGVQLVISNVATDLDVPGQILFFSLDPGAPSGATVHPTTGVFTWTPSADRNGTTNLVTLRVTDNGQPALSDTKSFNITVPLVPIIESIAVTPVNIVIGWSSIPGHTYQLQFKENLSDPAWQNLGDVIIAIDSHASTTDALPLTQRFYRIVVSD